ncbi:MAG: Cysteine desulfurase IscS [Nitrospira sp.]|nr:Cysteine desulfurase IscS [Nitrospira sp.]
MLAFFDVEFGNAGSRTHEFGQRAKRAVQSAREAVASVVACDPEEVHFTSGATESDNLALLGLAASTETANRRHIISTAIEHKAVLEPLEHLAKHGFDVTIVPVDSSGRVDSAAIREALRPDTLLLSVMHVNNETGAIQPIDEIVQALGDHKAYLHVDAAQGYGKELATLRSKRIDLISVSGHKIYGPKGVGALIARRRGFARIPLAPLMFGGGQERGLRPGTLPVPLIVGFGRASEVALRDHQKRAKRNNQIRTDVLRALSPFGAEVNGAPDHSISSTLNISLPGLDAEAVMVSLKDLIAISNGSACTSSSYTPSHVLAAMSLPKERINGALRLSWCHMTEEVDWSAVTARLKTLT